MISTSDLCLLQMRLENKEKKQQEVEDLRMRFVPLMRCWQLEEEAAMYKKGFRDAQKQLDPQAFKHPSASQGSPDVHSQEQAEALHVPERISMLALTATGFKVINRFLHKSGRSPTTHHLYTSDDLAKVGRGHCLVRSSESHENRNVPK